MLFKLLSSDDVAVVCLVVPLSLNFKRDWRDSLSHDFIFPLRFCCFSCAHCLSSPGMTRAGKVRKVCVLIVTRALGMESTTTVSINGCCCWHWQNEREEGDEEEAGGKTLIRSWWCCCCWRKHFALRCLPFLLCVFFAGCWFSFVSGFSSLCLPLCLLHLPVAVRTGWRQVSLYFVKITWLSSSCISISVCNCHTSGLLFYAVFFSTRLIHCVSRKCF